MSGFVYVQSPAKFGHQKVLLGSGLDQSKVLTHICRLLDSARVLKGQICYNMKDINLVHNFFLNRFNMHSDLYNHKTSLSVSFLFMVFPLIKTQPELSNT